MSRRPRSRTTRPWTLPFIHGGNVSRPVNMGKKCTCVNGQRSRYGRQLLEICVFLAGKTDDRHLSEAQSTHRGEYDKDLSVGRGSELHGDGVQGRLHRGEHAIFARVLQRQVEMRREAAALRHTRRCRTRSRWARVELIRKRGPWFRCGPKPRTRGMRPARRLQQIPLEKIRPARSRPYDYQMHAA